MLQKKINYGKIVTTHKEIFNLNYTRKGVFYESKQK